MLTCPNCGHEFAGGPASELLTRPGMFRCPSCRHVTDAATGLRPSLHGMLPAIMEGRVRTAELLASCEKFGRKFRASLLCWIDQTNDEQQIANKAAPVFEGSRDGVCVALACEWIRRNVQGSGTEFRTEIARGIDYRYRQLQEQHAAISARIRIMADEIEREALAGKALRQTMTVEAQLKDPTAFNARSLRVAQHIARAELVGRAARQLNATRLIPFTVERTRYEHVPDSGAAATCASIATGVKARLTHPGYYFIQIIGSGRSGHAMAMHIGSGHDTPRCRLFDANTGEWACASVSDLLTFFGEYWKVFYSKRYGGGSFQIFAFRERATVVGGLFDGLVLHA